MKKAPKKADGIILGVLVPPWLKRAVENAAAKEFVTPSEWVRERLKDIIKSSQ